MAEQQTPDPQQEAKKRMDEARLAAAKIGKTVDFTVNFINMLTQKAPTSLPDLFRRLGIIPAASGDQAKETTQNQNRHNRRSNG